MEQPTKKQKTTDNKHEALLEGFASSVEFAKAQTYNINDEYSEKIFADIEEVVDLVLEAAKTAAANKKNIFDFDVPKPLSGFSSLHWALIVMKANHILFVKNFYLDKYPRTSPRTCTFTLDTFPNFSK
jgi:hypothetical protein